MLLQKDGNKFFFSNDRHKHAIPTPKPIHTIHKEYKFGLSKDSPYISRLSYVNSMTSSLFDATSPKSQKVLPRITPIQPHKLLSDCLRRAKGDANSFNHLLRAQTPAKPVQKKIFTILLDKSLSKEIKIKQSLLNPFNIRTLHASVLKSDDSPYKDRLATFTKKMREPARVRGVASEKRIKNGFACLITEGTSKNSSQCF